MARATSAPDPVRRHAGAGARAENRFRIGIKQAAESVVKTFQFYWGIFWPIKCSIDATSWRSSAVMIVNASPTLWARPVRPIRWT